MKRKLDNCESAGMDLLGIAKAAALLTCLWMGQTFFLHSFLREHPPRANVVDAGVMDINGQSIEYPQPTADQMKKADLSLTFETAKQYEENMSQFRRHHIWYGVLAILLSVGTFIVGWFLGEDWRYGIACVLVGPLAVSWTGYRMVMADRRTRLWSIEDRV